MPETTDLNWLTVVNGHYLVTLYSNEPLAALKRAAVRVMVVAATQGGFHGIPSNWPPPGPAPTPPTGVHIVLLGRVNISWSAAHPQLTYSFRYGNSGSVNERYLRFTLVLPRGVAFAGRVPPPGSCDLHRTG